MKLDTTKVTNTNEIIIIGDTQEPICWVEAILKEFSIPYQIKYSDGIVKLELKPPIDKYKITYICDVGSLKVYEYDFVVYLIDSIISEYNSIPKDDEIENKKEDIWYD